MDGCLFIHVPKTAGYSLWHSFRNLFGADSVTPHFGDGRLSDGEVSEFRSKEMIAGHMSHSDVMAHFPDRLLLTALREPVDRAISQYYFARTLGDPNEESVRITRAMEIEEYFSLDPRILSRTVANRMTRQLGSHCLDTHADLAVALPKAKQLLQQCHWVGFFENLQNDVERLKTAVPVLASLAMVRERVTPQRLAVPDIGTSLKSRILEINSFDLELYEWAKREFWG